MSETIAADTPPDPEPPRTSLPELASHLRNGSVLLSLLFLAKAYGVAHYSLTTMGELLSTAPLAALLGTITSYMYVILPIVAVGGGWWLWETRHDFLAVRPAATAFVLLAAILSPWPYLWVVLAGGGAMFLVTEMARRAYGSVGVVRTLARHASLYYSVAVAMVFFVATLDKPWVPAEVVVTDGPVLVRARDHRVETNPIVFVLSEKGGDLVAVTARDRYVVRIPLERITARIICHHRGQLGGHRPLLEALKGNSYDSPNISCGRLQREIAAGSFEPVRPSSD